MLISQLALSNGQIAVLAREDGAPARIVNGATSVYDLAMEAADKSSTIEALIDAAGLGEEVDLAAAIADRKSVV